MIYSWIFRNILAHTNPEQAHHGGISAIAGAGRIPILRDLISLTFGRSVGTLDGPWVGTQKDGFKTISRRIPGRMGLAAGMDKDAVAIEGLAAMGFAYIEIGTVTGQAQPGNERPRMWRLVPERAIRNRMGFNNSGAAQAGRRLRKLRSTPRGRSIVVGANIGKTKVVSLADAIDDYVVSTREVARWSDYLVVNVSSPNTPGLRSLQSVESLRPILAAVQAEADRVAQRRMPLFVKIAPDLADADIDAVADLANELDLAGIVATNTTIDHDLGEGGLSGAPLTLRALQVVRQLRQRLDDKRIIMGVGGISSISDAENMLAAGADLLQGLTAFVYQGPSWPGRINRAL